MKDKYGENDLPKGKLSDYFDLSVKLDKNKDSYASGLRVQSYISISNNADKRYKSYKGVYLLPLKSFVNELAGIMLAIENDSIFFEIVIREDKSCLFLASYNLIIGNRWLCELEYGEVIELLI